MITFDLKPLKALTPSTPKHANFETMSSCFKSFCHDQQSQVVSSISREHLLHIQQQRYFTPILHNVTMLTCPTCIVHGCDPITSKRNKVGILNNKLSCLKNFIMYVYYNLLTNPSYQFFGG